ncbi:MAG: DUF6622 family protein [Devosiaceae bacterium]
MSTFLLGIWHNAPIWVWPLFVVLVVIGTLSMRARNSSIVPYFFYPLFGLSAANGIASLVHTPANWIIFGIAYILGVGLAFVWQDALVITKQGMKVHLKGERLTFVIVMTIFFSNFVNGVVEVMRPELQQNLVFTLVFASLIGACSGSFTGRALRVLTLPTRVPSGAVAV